ncbi:MAG: hypothetical protein AAGA81_09670, partial [Acidobacteriota bacterium]
MPLAFRLTAVLFVLFIGAANAAVPGELELRHKQFLEQTHYLLQPVEREVWEQLTENYQRDAFIRR